MSMGMWVNEGTPTTSFVLYTINVECMCDASYVTWKYRQYRRYHVIFARKYKTMQNVNILGARFNSSGTSFFKLIFQVSDVPHGPLVHMFISLSKGTQTWLKHPLQPNSTVLGFKFVKIKSSPYWAEIIGKCENISDILKSSSAEPSS